MISCIEKSLFLYRKKPQSRDRAYRLRAQGQGCVCVKGLKPGGAGHTQFTLNCSHYEQDRHRSERPNHGRTPKQTLGHATAHTAADSRVATGTATATGARRGA